MKFCYNTYSTLPNNAKDLDPSYKTDLELLDCFGREKVRLITEETGRSYGYGISVSSLIRKTVKVGNRLCDPWIGSGLGEAV